MQKLEWKLSLLPTLDSYSTQKQRLAPMSWVFFQRYLGSMCHLLCTLCFPVFLSTISVGGSSVIYIITESLYTISLQIELWYKELKFDRVWACSSPTSLSSFLLVLSPGSCCSRHTGLFAIPWAHLVTPAPGPLHLQCPLFLLSGMLCPHIFPWFIHLLRHTFSVSSLLSFALPDALLTITNPLNPRQ